MINNQCTCHWENKKKNNQDWHGHFSIYQVNNTVNAQIPRQHA
jgi:hypothetical protein